MAADTLHFAQCMSPLLGAVMFGLFFPPQFGDSVGKERAQDRDVLWLQVLKY